MRSCQTSNSYSRGVVVRRVVLGVFFCAALAFMSSPAVAAIWYVDKDNSGTQNGTSWATAFTAIQPAVDAANSAGGGEVWVAEGTYTGATDPIVTLKANVQLYGGFSGSETTRDLRDWIMHVSTIDGENARRCVTMADGSLLDGLHIVHGKTPFVGGDGGTWDTNSGGGIYVLPGASVAMQNSTLQENRANHCGGGLFAGPDTSGTITIEGCSFVNNRAEGDSSVYGGALSIILANGSGDTSITRCSFNNNSALNGGYNSSGGVIHMGAPASQRVTFDNCVFWANQTGTNGGVAIVYNTLSAMFRNCSFSGNTAGSGNIIECSDSSTATFTNCVIWSSSSSLFVGNPPTITYSDVYGGYAGTGNINASPLFVNSANGDLHLQAGSPCIDTGTSDGAPDQDIEDRARPIEIAGKGVDSLSTAYDMGAYEFTQWTLATSGAAWTPRITKAVVHNAEMYVLGGHDGSNKSDVWQSGDGVTWTRLADAAPWGPRSLHSVVSFNGQLWVIGGQSAGSPGNNDVWMSNDGVNWTQVTASAQWSARSQHTSVVFDNKIWVMGGNTSADPGSFKSDVWCSSDGASWQLKTSAAPWGPRSCMASAVFAGKIWVIGGTYGSADKNDVWASPDGTNWQRATDAWPALHNEAAVVAGGRLWVIGGYPLTNQAWFSEDGSHWTLDATTSPWSARTTLEALSFENKIWLVGGDDSTFRNDIWSMSVAQRPLITAQPQSQTVNPGVSASFSVTASGTLPLSYQWKKNGTAIPGATKATYSVSSAQQADVGDYVCTVSNLEGSAESNSARLILTMIVMLPGSVPLEMVWIQPGTFMMGRYAGEQDSFAEWEDPQHQVTLAHGFWMGKYEVTQAQWVAVMGSNPSTFTGDASRPVEWISWNDITQTNGFLDNLNQANPGVAFRLPTEAEWEYACRAGTTTRFYWGDDPSYSEIGTYAWWPDNSGGTTHPVGTAGTTGHPNAWGLYDMSGNVWEWCQDWWHDNYTGAPTDGSAWENPTSLYRVMRGSSWGPNHPDYPRAAYRSRNPPGSGFNYVGLRLVRNADSSTVTIITQPVSQTVNSGDSVSFSVAAQGMVPLSYQWRKAGSVIPGATNAMYGISSAQQSDEGSYTCVVTNSVGSATSNAATLVVRHLAILTQPVSITVNPGDPASFAVSATGTPPLSYQWKKNNVAIDSATDAAYSIVSAQQSSEGSYTCMVTDTEGSLQSGAATLMVNDSPAITTQPQSRTVIAGSSVTFSVTATGTPPLSYQWRKDEATIPGANLSNYSVANAQTTNGGSYVCIVSNMAGSVASNAATLVVNTQQPVADFTANPRAGTAPLEVQFTDTSQGHGRPTLSWSWDFGDGGTSTQQSPRHTYQNTETYDVSLTVTTDAGSGTETKTAYISASATGECTGECITMWIPDRSASPGGWLQIPLNMELPPEMTRMMDARDLWIRGVDIDFLYDPNVLDVETIEVQQTAITARLSCAVNKTEPGRVRISAIGDITDVNAKGVGQGHLLDIRARVYSDAVKNTCSQMSYDPDPSRYVQIAMEDHLGDYGYRPVTYGSMGQICVIDACRAGDIDNSGRVDSMDALLALKIAVGKVDEVPCKYAGDLNGDSVVDSADAIMIQRLAVGLMNPPVTDGKSVTQESMLLSSVLADTPYVRVEVDGAAGFVGDEVRVVVTLDNAKGLCGLNMKVSYPKELLLQGVEWGSLLDSVPHELKFGNGYVRIGAGRQEGSGASKAETETLVALRFQITQMPTAGSATVAVDECELKGQYGDSFKWFTAVMLAPGDVQIYDSPVGEGEGEGEPTEDNDGDGVSNGDEALYRTDPDNPDTDGDGMPDGWEVNGAHMFNPLVPDGDSDPDGDGYTNLQEYLLGSDPHDPTSPVTRVFVSPGGDDANGTGSTESPWRTIGHAIAHESPSHDVPLTVVLRPGDYEGNIDLKPYLSLEGSNEGVATIVGSVVGTSDSALRDLVIVGPGEGLDALLSLDNAVMKVEGVTFAGALNKEGLGVLTTGDVSGTVIDQCHFVGLSTGIDISGTIPTIRRTLFEQLGADGIVFRAEAGTKESAADNMFSETKNPNSGFNLFRIGTIDGKAVVNERATEVLMQNNEWDSTNEVEIGKKIDGQVRVWPFLQEGEGLIPASVVCAVWNADTQDPVLKAAVKLAPGNFDSVTDNELGMYTIACLKGGTYAFSVEAAGYASSLQQATLTPGMVTPLMFPMIPTGSEGEGEGEGEQTGGCFGGSMGDAMPPAPNNGGDTLALAGVLLAFVCLTPRRALVRN